MDAELTKLLNEALAGLIQTTSDAQDFLVAELPATVTELLRWVFWSSLIEFIIGILCFVYITLAIRFVFKNHNREWFYTHSPVYGKTFTTSAAVCLAIVGVTSFIGIIAGGTLVNLTWLKVMVAPRIYVIEYLSQLIK